MTDSRRVSYLLQPGIPVEDAAPVIAALRSRFPALHGPHPDGFCYAASDRAETVRVIASASDAVLVLGAPDAPDSRRISALARDCGARTHVVSSAWRHLPGHADRGERHRPGGVDVGEPGAGRAGDPRRCPGSAR